MKFWRRFVLAWWVAAIVLSLPASSSGSLANSPRQTETAEQKARAMLADLTPEERVGQLFLVTFQGNTFDENSVIARLIETYHVGGVILQRSNDNFTNTENIPAQALALNRLLQEREWQASQQPAADTGGEAASPSRYIPLLIGISQEGNAFPNDQLLSGLTPLPSLMSIGATWNPDYAQQVGAVLGKELAALGFNLYLGPSLDVLSAPQTNGEDLGVRTFGGSPYWVGKMGQSYISGLHQGSQNRLMVVAKYFPGRGGADRSTEQELATVRKPLDLLTEIDLAPFFAATGNAPDQTMTADGLLVSHIRYEGLQGTIRSTTRPVSSDAAALEQIFALEPFRLWRENDGVMISDNLGSQAVRGFYDPNGTNFDARTVAREAFVAGNDMLYVDRFVASTDPDTFTTLTNTIDYFTQKYREDDIFAQRVDASVERILTLKYRLYPEFDLAQVLPADTSLTEVGGAQSVTFDVARSSVTLISPDPADLLNILPRGPETRDRIVFLTDSQMGQQCSSCAEESLMPVDALQSAVLRLYGPRSGGQISQNSLTSYGFSDLAKYLQNYASGALEEQPAQLDTDLRMADWVVVSLLKPDANKPETLAFERLLLEHPDLLRNKKVIVFAFDAPYYLDATDISKLTAYYGLYGKTDPFIEVAARILFQDLSASGAGTLPVSVAGVGYDLGHATSPDPGQVIPLFIDSAIVSDVADIGTLEPTPAPVFRVGDVIPLRTGVIYDRNHKPVEDGTATRFIFSVISESSGSTLTQTDTRTVDGVARAVYRIDRAGLLEIHAASDEGAISNLLRLDITTGVSAGVTLVAPTPQPTDTMVPTPTITPTEAPTPTATPLPPAVVNIRDWFFALLIMLGGSAVVAWIGIRRAIARWGLRWALCGLIGGLIFFNYVALGLPGSESLLREAGSAGVVLLTIIGVIFGWGVGLLWRQIDMQGGGRAGERAQGERPATGTGPKSQSS